MSFRRWQELVVTELTPAHHSRENSQRSLTTHVFTVMFILLRFLSETKCHTGRVKICIRSDKKEIETGRDRKS